MTWTQLAHEQNALERAHADNDVSRMLKGVVSNTHLLAKLSREAGFTPYVGHAHYIYACYLKSQISLRLIVILAQCGRFKWIWIRTCLRLVPCP